jgi:N-acetylmuramoyl-L-alanine amidase
MRALYSNQPEEDERREGVANEILARLRIIKREEWNAEPPKKNLEPDWDYRWVTVHHSGYGLWHPTPTTPRAIRDFHEGGDRDWDDIGYHYCVGIDGRIYEGRRLVYKGAHVKHNNTGKIGIVCLGNFDSAWYDVFSSRVGFPLYVALYRLIVTLRGYFPIAYLGGHVEYTNDGRTCPGGFLLDTAKKLRMDLRLSPPLRIR